MPWSNRYSAASSTSTSPASEATIGLSMPLAAHLLDHLDHDLREHHRRRDDRVPVAEDQRVDARILEAEADRVLVGLRRLAAGDVDRVAGGAERRDELAERRVEVGGIAISFRPLSTQASDSSTPEPPAPVMMTTFSPFGVGSIGIARANSSRSRSDLRADHARLPQHVVVDLVVAGERAGVRAGARAPMPVRPAFSTTTGFFFDTRFATSANARPSFRSSQCCAMIVRVVVLLEEREQVVLVDVATCCRGRRSPTRPSSPSARSR